MNDSTMIRVGLSGLGTVHRNLIHLLWRDKRSELKERYGLEFRCIWACDTSGFRVSPAGFDTVRLAEHKSNGSNLAAFTEGELVEESQAMEALSGLDLLFEATSVELDGGGLGLRLARAATSRGIHLVLANKAPVVIDYSGLHEASRNQSSGLAYSATVCGGLPVVNLGSRELVAAKVTRLRGIFNSTTNYMLGEMARGSSYDEALAEAQARGIAETDPRNDVEGWDSASKLVILANSVLGQNIGLDDVRLRGIDASLKFGEDGVTKLIADATLEQDGSYQYRVEPQVVDRDSFLGSCDGWEMGAEFETDIYGKIFLKIWEREPIPTAAAMMRDAVHLLAAKGRADGVQ